MLHFLMSFYKYKRFIMYLEDTEKDIMNSNEGHQLPRPCKDL